MRKRKPLSDSQVAAAKKLKDIWERSKADFGSQEAFAHLCGWESQGAFSQYLLGRVPINLDALLTMARTLKIHPREIFPELIERHDLKYLFSSGLDVNDTIAGNLKVEEQSLIIAYRKLSRESKDKLTSDAGYMLSLERQRDKDAKKLA